ncbi:hypothetical protein WJ970_25255 [Achromobacter xylosoxidans]
MLKDFTACDGSFFSSLHQDRKAWDGVPLGGAGNVSGIRVPDRNDKARNSVVFKRAINVNGLALTEYMDWYVDGKSLGKMLFWGFTISGRPAEVMERLRPLIKDEERLRKDGAGFMRAEVKIAQSPWVPAIVNSGAAAGLNKVERTLMIDLDESKNEVTVMCSLQGGLTATVLKEVRPDMAEKEYPRELQAATFEDAPIPKDVAATAQSILAVRRGMETEIQVPELRRTVGGRQRQARPSGQDRTARLARWSDIEARDIWRDVLDPQPDVGQYRVVEVPDGRHGGPAPVGQFGIASGHAASLAAGHDGQRRKAKRQRARVRR